MERKGRTLFLSLPVSAGWLATVEHPTECGPIDGAGMDAEANDPARVLIHDHKDPVGPQRSLFAPEQIHAPEAVFRVPQESQPGRTIRILFRPVVTDENPRTTSLSVWMLNAKAICCAIRGEPQLGLRCFISTTKWMSSVRGPFGPGFRWRFDENSMRYFRLDMALC